MTNNQIIRFALQYVVSNMDAVEDLYEPEEVPFTEEQILSVLSLFPDNSASRYDHDGLPLGDEEQPDDDIVCDRDGFPLND